MLNITNAASFARALDSPIADPTKALLRLRRDQLLNGGDHDIGTLVQFIVIEPGDALPQVEVAAGYPVVTTGAFEWVADHGYAIEAVAILSDDGFAIVVLCPDDPSMDAELITRLRDQVTPANRDEVTDPKR